LPVLTLLELSIIGERRASMEIIPAIGVDTVWVCGILTAETGRVPIRR
jgi:hypothetical protein